MTKDMEFRRTIKKQPGGIVRQRNRDTPWPNPTLDTCITKAKEFRRTISEHTHDLILRLLRAIPMPQDFVITLPTHL